MTDGSAVTGATVTGPAAGGGADPVRRRGYRLTAGLLLVIMLGGILPVPLYVLRQRPMGFGPLGSRWCSPSTWSARWLRW